MNWIIFVSGNGLSPIRHQAITWTNAHLLFIEPLGTKSSDQNTKVFVQENVFENVTCEMAAIFSGVDELRHISKM